MMYVIYRDDLSKMQLQAQLPLLQALFAERNNQSELSIHGIFKLLLLLPSSQWLALSNVWVLMKLLLVMHITNISFRASFSGLWRIKMNLRTTMTQMRLSDSIILSIHAEETDLLT